LTFAVPLQEVFRTSYHWLVDGAYGDKEVSVGGQIAVRLPAEFASHDWEHFQPESAAAVARWAKHHQRGIVLDVGESSGIDSLVALFSDPQIEVVKLDSDLLRLARIRRLCKLAPGERLRLVYGFIGASCTKSRILHGSASQSCSSLGWPWHAGLRRPVQPLSCC